MLKVIGAGFGRTGTTSLKHALEQLGFGPCHHMDEVFKNPQQIPMWLDVAAGKSADWDRIFTGYHASVDFPSQHWYQALMVKYPDAKVILSVRDPESWYRSTRETIYAVSEDIPIRWVGRYLPVMGGVVRLASGTIWKGLYKGKFLDKTYSIGVFNQHIADVRAHVPPERLLVFDVKEGWGPLCAFLNVEIPSSPFPRLNDTVEFKRRVLGLKLLCWSLILVPLLVLGLIISGFLWSRMH
jgi:hypothetical protein